MKTLKIDHQALEAARVAKGLSYTALAAMAGLDYWVVYRTLTGRTKGLEPAHRLARALGLRPQSVVSLTV